MKNICKGKKKTNILSVIVFKDIFNSITDNDIFN